MKYGSASYIAPDTLNFTERINHIVDIFEPLLPKLKKHGATEWHIDIGRIYFAQCNEELSLEELNQIHRLQCGITYSAYIVYSQEEEDEGFDSPS